MSKQVVADVLSPNMAAQIWTGNYAPVFPFTPQDFRIGAILPAVLYMLRWGHRRGKGNFYEAFQNEGYPKPTISSVADKLRTSVTFEGFDNDVGRMVLGDLLLSFLLQNRKGSSDHEEQIIRVFPAHYFASWIDLPHNIANLRGVPEMVVALLVKQSSGEELEAGFRTGRLQIGCRINENELLTLFAPGTKVEGDYKTSLTSDKFDEASFVGVDQLLAIRVAQACGSAPTKAAGKGERSPIINQWPLASCAADQLHDDLLVFLKAYGSTISRLSLLPMLEACIAIGLTNIFLSTIRLLQHLVDNGRVPDRGERTPWPIFIDASQSNDPDLRNTSDRSVEYARRQLAQVPRTLMLLRLLDYEF